MKKIFVIKFNELYFSIFSSLNPKQMPFRYFWLKMSLIGICLQFACQSYKKDLQISTIVRGLVIYHIHLMTSPKKKNSLFINLPFWLTSSNFQKDFFVNSQICLVIFMLLLTTFMLSFFANCHLFVARTHGFNLFTLQ